MTVISATKSKIFQNKVLFFGAVFCTLVLIIAAVSIVAITKLTKAEDSSWNYHEQDQWSGLCQSGQSQSPIALCDTSANQTQIQALVFENGNIDNIEITNSGHTVIINLDNTISSKPQLSGGGLIGKFTLSNIHFHWPSEHVINGIQYPLESHFVFIAEEYSSIDAALEVPFAVTVVGIVYAESDDVKHQNFQKINEAVQQISTKPGETLSTSNSINIFDFLPEDPQTFFKYSGSLTTPNCIENINWFVLKSASSITSTQLEGLANIYTEEGEFLEFNNRLLQNRNQRTIFLKQGST